MRNYDLVVITGPTATGKTAVASAVAAELKGEVISADSRQVYRRMDIGTGKDYGDYIVGGRQIPVHLIDIVEPGYRYNVFEYQRDFLKVYSDMKSRNVFPVVCGGSGMYVDSVVTGYRLIEVPPDPVFREEMNSKTMEELTGLLKSYKTLHNKTDIDSKKRVIRALEIEKYYLLAGEGAVKLPSVKPLIAGIYLDRENRRKRISERLEYRLKNGMIDEVRKLLDDGIDSETLIYYGLEYKYITRFLMGEITCEEMMAGLETAIHRYAKRQMTWFRGMERKGIKIHWIDGLLQTSEKVSRVINLLES
jgi:tRNA dimethylallyltransferase